MAIKLGKTVTPSLGKEITPMANRGTIDWQAIKMDYLLKSIRINKSFSMKKLADEWNIPHGSLRNRASMERWSVQLKDKLDEQRGDVVSQVQTLSGYKEVEVRMRQTDLSRIMMEKAGQRIKRIKPDELTIKEAIEMARLGMEQERKALGMPDKFEVSSIDKPETAGEFASVEERISKHSRMVQLANKLGSLLEEEDAEEAEYVEAERADEPTDNPE